MSVLALSLAIAAGAQDGSTEAATLKTDFVTTARTEELAKAVLPPEIAGKVIGHKLSPPHLHWIEGYPARFWGEATLLEPGFCRRDTYYVPMPQKTKGTLSPGAPSPSAEIAMATDCSDPTATFIALNRSSPEKVVELLRWFKDVHRKAGGSGELAVDVECRCEMQPDPCLKGPRRVLAALPIKNISIVEHGGRIYDGEDWRVSIRSENASGSYWQLSIFNFSSERPRIRISWGVIPPF